MDAAPRLADLTRTDFQQLQAADLMRALCASAFGRHEGGGPAAYFAERWPTSVSKDLVVRAFDPGLHTKAAVAAGTTTDATWGGPLTVPAALVAAFVPLIARQSALLQLPLRRVPFATPVSTQTGDASYAWVAENKTKPVSKFAFSNVSLGPTKVSGIVVLTKELARLTAPGSVEAMQAALAAGLASFVDRQLLDPAVTAIAGERPASITNGVTAVTGGTTVAEKVAALISAFFTALPQASASTTLIMSPATAGQLAATGQQPTLTVAGGTAFGLRVVTTPSAEADVIILDPTRVLTAREEAPVLDTSDQAAVQMDSAPTDPPTAAVVLLSFWQHDRVGIKCEWKLTWQALPNSVAYCVVA